MDAMKALPSRVRVLAEIPPRINGLYLAFVIATLSLTQLLVALDFHFGKLALVLFMKGARLTLAYSHEHTHPISRDLVRALLAKIRADSPSRTGSAMPKQVAGCTHCG
jgi:hypothetical protein